MVGEAPSEMPCVVCVMPRPWALSPPPQSPPNPPPPISGCWHLPHSTQQMLLSLAEQFGGYVSVFCSFKVLYFASLFSPPLFLSDAWGRIRIVIRRIWRERKSHCSVCDITGTEAGFLSRQHWLWQERRGFPTFADLPLVYVKHQP